MEISPSLINTILILVFVLVLVGTALAGLIGFLKGIYKTTLKTILKTILVVIFVFVSPFIANAVGQINIENLVNSDTPISIQTWVANWITNTGIISPINGMSLYETAIALTNSLISYAVFLVAMILVQCFASLLTMIFYQGIFRFILPVETKKEYKERKANKNKAILTDGLLEDDGTIKEKPKKKWKLHKPLGAALGALQEFVFLFVLLSPLTSLSRTAIHNEDSILKAMETSGQSQENIDTTKNYLSAISSSPLYVVSSTGMDTVIMNKVSSVKLNNTTVSVDPLVNSLFDIAKPVLDSGSISYDEATKQVTVNFSNLLSVEMVSSVLDGILENPLFVALMPSLLDAGLNSVTGDAALALDSLDFSNIDITSELSIVKSIYADIYDSGIEPMIEGNSFDINKFCLKTSAYTDEDIAKLTDALKKFGTLETVKKNMGVILASIGTYLKSTNVNILPTDPASYDKVDWSNDLNIIGSAFLRFFRDAGLDITPNLQVKSLQSAAENVFKEEQKRKNLETYIVGSDTEEGLLDLSFFNVLSVSDIISSLLSSVPSLTPYVADIDFSTLLANYTSEDYKKEFLTMFDMLGILYDPDSSISLENIQDTDISDQATADELAELLSFSEKSKIFTALYPKILRNVLFNTTLDFGNQGHDSFYLFGLTPYNFNYEASDFIENFRTILTLLPKIKTMYDTLSDDSTTAKEKLDAIDEHSFASLLKIVATSQFFNSDVRTGILSEEQKNVNIYTFLKNLFDTSLFKDNGFVLPYYATVSSIDWTDEVDKIKTILTDIKANSDFFTAGSKERTLSKIEDVDAFGDIISTGLDLELFKPTILSLIDTSLNNFLEERGIHMKLSEVRNSVWKSDSDNITDLIKLLKQIGGETFDLTKLSPDILNALLTNFYSSNYIQEAFSSSSSPDPFGMFLYQLLTQGGFFSSLGVNDVDASVFDLDDSDNWSAKQDKTGTYPMTTEGEIQALSSLLGSLQTKIDANDENSKTYLDELEAGSMPTGFASQLSGEALSSSFLRKMMASLLSSKLDSLSLEGNFSSIKDSFDFSLLSSLTNKEFQEELALFETLYSWSNNKVTGKDGNSYSWFTYLEKYPFALDTVRAYPSITDESDPKYSIKMLEVTDDLLHQLATSNLMNNKKASSLLTPYQSLLKALVTSLGLESKVTFNSSTDSGASLNAILISIPDMQRETENIKNLLSDLQGLDTSSFDLSSSTIEKTKLETILNDANASSLFHRLPAEVLNEVFSASDISDMLKDPDNGKVLHSLNFRVSLSISQNDVDFWNNEIENFLTLYQNFSNYLKKDKSGHKKSFTSISYKEVDGTSFAAIASSKIFVGARDYLFYNIVKKSLPSDITMDQVLAPSQNTPYGENRYAYRFEDIYFKDPKLKTSTGTFDKDKGAEAAECFLHALKDSVKYLETLLNDNSAFNLSTFTFDFEAFNDTAYLFLDDGTFERSTLASEFIAMVEEGVLKNETLPFHNLVNTDKIDLKEKDYALINSVEGRGLNGLLALAKLTNSKTMTLTPYTKTELTTIFADFGSKTTSSDDTKLNHFLALSDYKSGNSKIVLTSLSVLGKLAVRNPSVTTLGAVTSTISDTSYDFSPTTFATISFEEWLAYTTIA